MTPPLNLDEIEARAATDKIDVCNKCLVEVDVRYPDTHACRSWRLIRIEIATCRELRTLRAIQVAAEEYCNPHPRIVGDLLRTKLIEALNSAKDPANVR